MKWKRVVNESVDDEKDFKKLLRQNGITKLPSGMSSRRAGTLEWRKDGGYAGEKTIERMRKQAEDAGWRRGREMDDAHPDGSWVARGDVYVSPDGQIEMSYYSYYGATSYDNSFSITFKRIGVVSETFDFGFKVGDEVELIKDKENLITGDVIEAGSVGEVVAVDKPMRGLCKVKIDGNVSNIPVRSLKKVGEDEPGWKKISAKDGPKRNIEPERPEDYYMRPRHYGSPRYTGD